MHAHLQSKFPLHEYENTNFSVKIQIHYPHQIISNLNNTEI